MYSYSSYYDYGYNAAAAAVTIGILVVVLVVLIMLIVGMCKLFKKAGEPAWKVFIPIYSSYIFYKIADSVTLFIVSICLSVASYLLFPALSLGQIVIHIIFCVALARVFNKSGGFAIGLIFLYPIFILILAFGSAEYIGTNGANWNAGQQQPARPAPAPASQRAPSNENAFYRTAPVSESDQPSAQQEPRHLVGENGALSTRRIGLNGSHTIGTNPEYASIVYPRGTPGVSGKHCTITYTNGVVTVTDENSTYGTWIDDRKLTPGVPFTFHRGHRLSLGSVKETWILRD